MKKNKLKNSNAGSRFLLNKMFYISLIAWVCSSLLLVVLNLISSVNKEVSNAILGMFISPFSLIFAYCLGNFNSSKEKRIIKIKDYIKDIKKTRKNLQIIKNKFRKEFIYQYKDIIIFIESFLNKFEAQELDLIFVEKWKISRTVKQNLNNIIKFYKDNLKKFKESVKKLKKIGKNDKEINKIIEILIGINMERRNLNLILLNNSNEFKEIIINLNQFLFPFVNYYIEALKQNLDILINNVSEKENIYMKIITECKTHKHYNILKDKWPLCWLTIRKLEENINFN